MPLRDALPTVADSVRGPRISLIVPCWNNSSAAVELAKAWSGHPLLREVIIAAVARGPALLPADGWKVCYSDRPGRGTQLNLGANRATGDVLLFHHVDSHLSEAHLVSLERAMRDPRIVGGAFYRKFDRRHPHLLWAEPIERWHSRTFGALYGDQSIFVRREHFLQLGGFAPIPLMEDVEFTRRLRRSGPLALLDPPMATSPDRQIAHGPWRTTARNWLFLILFQFGVSPDLLHAWYYRKRKNDSSGATVGQGVPAAPETFATLEERGA
jgi:hypothetical protein